MFSRFLLIFKYKMPLVRFIKQELDIRLKKKEHYIKFKKNYPFQTRRLWRMWRKMFDDELNKTIESELKKAEG